MESQTKAFGALIAHARNWAITRARLRRLADSRRATPDDVKKAQALNAQAAKKLEQAVKRFDEATRGLTPRSRKKINWAEVAGAVAKIAGGVEQAVKGRDTPFLSGRGVEIIDVEGIPVNKT